MKTTYKSFLAFPLAAALAVTAAGCATGYQPKGYTGGYSETRLSERAFEVSFEGNAYTNALAAKRGAMRRAAELALQMGFFGFWVSGREQTVDTSIYSTPVRCNGGNCTGGDASMVEKPTATITVNMVTGPEASQAPPGIVVYDAAVILGYPPRYTAAPAR